jgi:3-oxoacyl-[acyl-carrier-protein] synthase II
MEPVLVTGLGTVSTVGTGVAAFWRGLSTADTRPAEAPDPLARMPIRLIYPVDDNDLPPGPDGADRITRMATAAAGEAVADAGLPPAGVDPTRLAVLLGTTMGAAGGDPYAVAAVLADRIGAQGEVSVIANACAASGYAVTAAADLIRAGEADVVLAGGVEGYSRVALACFNRLGAVDPVRCRPFDAHRRGTVFGEGAAMLVLESAAYARRRGATAYATLTGTGWSCDSHHLTAPEPTGAEIDRALRTALAEAGLVPAEIGCVVPHGTGTELNDIVESRVVVGAFDRVPVYSLKGVIGHTGGAAGAFATMAGALILRHGKVPPNPALDEPDPECPLWIPVDTWTPLAAPAVLVNAYAFGGNNVSLVLQPDGAP